MNTNLKIDKKYLKVYKDKKYNFLEMFNTKTGFSLRTGIIENGKDTGVNPFQRSYPSLLDVGIMGSCKNAENCNVGCYQGKINKPNMSFENFKKIINQSVNKTHEVALGGAGSPNEHENFVEIVKYAKDNGIIPNYTTSGIELTDEEIQATKNNCGAVAISWYKQPYTYKSIERFLEAGVKTNIHYVLGNSSIDEAIDRIKNNSFPKGINAVIFLMYKPIGCVKENNVLNINDPRVQEFYSLVDNNSCDFKIGLDACNIPGVINFSKKVDLNSTTPCDGGCFSAYITHDFYMLPCSFDTLTRTYAIDLSKSTILEAWNSKKFEQFRNYHRFSCKTCKQRANCQGGCPITQEINLCKKEERCPT